MVLALYRVIERGHLGLQIGTSTVGCLHVEPKIDDVFRPLQLQLRDGANTARHCRRHIFLTSKQNPEGHVTVFQLNRIFLKTHVTLFTVQTAT